MSKDHPIDDMDRLLVERDALRTVIQTEVDNARCYLAQDTPSAVEGPLSRMLAALGHVAPDAMVAGLRAALAEEKALHESNLRALRRLVGIPDGVDPKTLSYWCGTEKQWQGMRRGVVANALLFAERGPPRDADIPVFAPVGIAVDALRAAYPAPSPEEQVAVLMREVKGYRAAMRRALRESGCDGDLCAHAWHEDFRALGIRP